VLALLWEERGRHCCERGGGGGEKTLVLQCEKERADGEKTLGGIATDRTRSGIKSYWIKISGLML
jgi:hypothetical protein